MSLEHAALALIRLAPCSGYDLKKTLDESVAHFWTTTQSHVYAALERLHERGLIESERIDQEDRPARKVYSVTTAGVEELKRWLASPIPLEPMRLQWLVQLFFAYELSNEELRSLLEARARNIRARLEINHVEIPKAIARNHERVGDDRARALWEASVDYGSAIREAELRWIERFLARLEALPGSRRATARRAGKRRD